MRRCSGGPCSTYLVLRSRDVSPAASPAISSGRCRHPASVFRSRDVGTYGRAAGGGKFKKFKKMSFFFFFNFQYALSCALPAFCLFFL
ncbi:unnamed protein product, partial [Staurois parvus]